MSRLSGSAHSFQIGGLYNIFSNKRALVFVGSNVGCKGPWWLCGRNEGYRGPGLCVCMCVCVYVYVCVYVCVCVCVYVCVCGQIHGMLGYVMLGHYYCKINLWLLFYNEVCNIKSKEDWICCNPNMWIM